MPTWDYWRVISDAAQFQSVGWPLLWRQHNEHRILCQEIVFLADILLWRGRLILPLVVSFLCYIGSWLVLAWTINSDQQAPRSARLIATLLSGIIIGWKGSVVVLSSPFLLQWTLLQLSVLLAFAFLAQLRERTGNRLLAASIAAAAIATYTSSNALLLWPLLLVAAVLLRLDRARVIALAVSATVFIGLFFIGYQFTGLLNVSNLFLHPIYFAEFVGAFFSMPFGGMKSFEFAPRLGLTALVAAALLTGVAIRKRLLASRPGIVLGGWYVFTLASTVLTAAGRMDAHDPSFSAAKAFRYVSVPLVGWAVLVAFAIWVSARSGWKIASPAALALVSMVLLSIGFVKLRWWFEGNQNELGSEQLAALSVEDGLTDRLMLRKIFPDPEFVATLLPYMRAHRLSVFAPHTHGQWLGRQATQFSRRKMSNYASAQVSYVFPLMGGFEVTGWADESEQTRVPQWILFTNERDAIVGFGRRLPAGFPPYLHRADLAYSVGWAGFVNFKIPATSYSAYVVERGGLVPIQGTLSAPAIASLGPTDAGAPLAGIRWQADPSWTVGGIPNDINYGLAPPGVLHSSWSGSYQNTGRMTSEPFAAPANHCLVLPVLTGPYIGGQSVELRDADTGQTIMRAPMQEGLLVWQFWRVALPASAQHIEIVAQDQGRAWGQWTAVADPLACP